MKNGNHGEEIQTGENSEVTMEMKIGKMQRHQHCRAKPNSKRQNNKCSVGGNEKMREVSEGVHTKVVNNAHATSKPNKARAKWYITTNHPRKSKSFVYNRTNS